MLHNLISSFIIRETGITISSTPKIHVDDPSVDNQAIIFKETGFRIPLQLWGVFSYFPSLKPDAATVAQSNNVYLLTPSNWNPHSDA